MPALAPHSLLSRDVTGVAAGTGPLPTILTSALCVVITWVCVPLRLWTRAKTQKALGWDDWTILVALLFFTVYNAAIINITRHVTSADGTITWDDLVTAVTFLNVSDEFYIWTLIMLKISLGILFHRLAIRRWQRMLIYAAVATSTIFGIALFFFLIFECGPYKHTAQLIDRLLLNQCVSDAAMLGMTYTHAAVTMVTDWTFLILPFAIMNDSLMRGKSKYTIIALMTFASIGGVASIVRFIYIDKIVVPKADYFPSAKNFSIWSSIELGVGIAASSLITLRPLFRSLRDRHRASRRNVSTPWRGLLSGPSRTRATQDSRHVERKATPNSDSITLIEVNTKESFSTTAAGDAKSWPSRETHYDLEKQPSFPRATLPKEANFRSHDRRIQSSRTPQDGRRLPSPATRRELPPLQQEPGVTPTTPEANKQWESHSEQSERPESTENGTIHVAFAARNERGVQTGSKRSGLPLTMFASASADSVASQASFGNV